MTAVWVLQMAFSPPTAVIHTNLFAYIEFKESNQYNINTEKTA
jgi:hypothetical protein